jgi:hypothetical protein
MPTPGGLPKRGEVWERTSKLPPDWKPNTVRVVVLERGAGSYWSLRIWHQNVGKQLWVDASYYFQQGELKYIGPAGPETKAKLGL